MLRSEAFLPTSRETRGASSETVQLLRRAGLITAFGSGLWGLTPAGERVRSKILGRIHSGMAGIGGQEVRLPGLQYRRRWAESGRWANFEDEMFTFETQDGQDVCLAPSHEEGMVHLVDGRVRSYDDLPLLLYQVASKFRDDHARNGLVRCKEFTMKDAYSFHTDAAGLAETYRAVRGAYQRIFADLGLDYAVVEADNSVMGGSRSEEFVAPVEHGSDRLLACTGDCRFGVTDDHALFDRYDDGDHCPRCGGRLTVSDGIEVAHLFELGTRYSAAMGLTFDGPDGDAHDIVMGSYGIGIERLLQTIAQQHSDSDGLRWPVTDWGCIAPYRASIVPIGDDETVRSVASDIYEACKCEDVLLFDADRSVGERFAESDLLGIPAKIVVGNRYRETGRVEVETRAGDSRTLAPESVPEAIAAYAAGT